MTTERVVKTDAITNKHFAEKNEEFRAACVEAKIDPTTRQASKWRLKKGKAFKSK